MRLSKVFSNTGWILVGSGFNKVSSIVLLVILSRYLGAEDFGRFSFAFFYIQIFSGIAEFGLTPILTKHISLNIIRPNEVQGKGIGLGLVATSVGIFSAWVGAHVLGYPAGLKYLIVVASLGLLISFRDVTFRWILEAPFRARLKMAYPVTLGVLSELLGLCMVLFVIYLKGSLNTILTTYVLSNLPGFIGLLFLSTREMRPTLKGHTISTTEIIKEAAPIGISNILMTIYLMFGSLVLFHFKGAVDVGYYALAFRLTTSLRIIPESIMHSFFPLIAKTHVEEPSRVKDIFEKAVKYGALIAFPLTLGTMVVSATVVQLLGGEQFQSAAIALSILIWATFFAFFNTALRYTFNAISLQRYNLRVSILMTAVSIILAFVLIPQYGFVGACFSLAACEVVGLIYGLIIANTVSLRLPVANFGKDLLASSVMAASIWFMPSFVLQVILGASIYVVVNMLIRGIGKDDLLKLFPLKLSGEI